MSLGPGPGMVGMVILGQDPTQINLLSVLTKASRSLNSFAVLSDQKKRMYLLSFSKNQGAWVRKADSWNNQKGFLDRYLN